MSYPIDARNHYKAINSEINLSDYNYQIEIIFGRKIKKYVHLGGTKTKTDVEIIFFDNSTEKITLKSKKNIKIGSFDWVNTTCFYKEDFNDSFDIFIKYKGSQDLSHKIILENTIESELKNMDGNKLTEMFLNYVYNAHSRNNLNILVIDEKTKTITRLEPKIFDLIKNGYKLKIQNGKGKTSCKVLCENIDGLQVDLGLRVRVHLNNGWTKWSKGENSVLCLKFQQDKVYKMLKD
jgi:hypothetical protein